MLKELIIDYQLFTEKQIKTIVKIGERKVRDINDVIDDSKVIDSAILEREWKIINDESVKKDQKSTSNFPVQRSASVNVNKASTLNSIKNLKEGAEENKQDTLISATKKSSEIKNKIVPLIMPGSK